MSCLINTIHVNVYINLVNYILQIEDHVLYLVFNFLYFLDRYYIYEWKYEIHSKDPLQKIIFMKGEKNRTWDHSV